MAAQQGSWSAADKADFQRQRLEQEMQRGLYKPGGPVARYLAGQPPVKAEPKDTFRDLTETLNRQLEKAMDEAVADKTAPTRDEIEQAAAEGRTLRAAQESTCFASLEYMPLDADTGTVIATFRNGYGPYESAE